MDKIVRKSFSILMIMLMIIPYTWLVFAEDAASETPESAPVQNEEVQPAEAVQPTPEPAAEPESAAEPEPEAAPTPAAEAEPATTPAAEPEPEAAPTPAAEAEPATTPAAEAKPEAAPEPAAEPEPAPAAEPEPEAAPAPEPEPEAAPATVSEEPEAAPDEPDQAVTGPEEAAAVKEEAAADPAAAEPAPEAEAIETPVEAEEEPKSEEAVPEVAAGDDTAPEPEAAGAESSPEQEPAEPAKAPALRALRSSRKAPEKSITIEGTVLDCSSAGSGNGWSYDSSNNTITLKDFGNKADITTDKTGVTIVTTGLNRIGTLSCDGQIDVIGTGILLIDNIELAEGCDFNLHSLKEWYGEDGGSAAVFLRQDDGSYKLINGSVEGVIDEEITLPEGTTLVLPENSKLKVAGIYIGVKYDEESNPTYCYREMNSDTPMDPDVKPENITYLVGAITVDNLILYKNAVISQVKSTLSKGLHILNSLVNNGTISGNSVTIDGYYSGSGTLESAKIYVNKGQELNITIQDSMLNLNGSYVINKITNSGRSELKYDNKYGETTIRDIKMADGDRLDIFGNALFPKGTKLNLTGSLSGGNAYLWSGITDIKSQFKILDGGKFHYATEEMTSSATVFDYSGTGTLSTGIGGPVFMGPSGFGSVPDQTAVPVEAFYLEEYIYLDGRISTMENYDYGEEYNSLIPFNVSYYTSTDGVITLDDLDNFYLLATSTEKTPYGYEVIRYTGGVLSMSVLGEKFDYSCPDDNILLIRVIVDYKCEHQPLGGSPETTTLASRTGSGVIGGNSNSIMTGTGIKRSSDEFGEEEIAKPVNTDTGKKNKSGNGKVNKSDGNANKSDGNANKSDGNANKSDGNANKSDTRSEKSDVIADNSGETPEDNENPEGEDNTGSGTAKHGKLVTVAAAEGNTLTYQIEEFDLNEGKEDAEKAIYYTLTAFLNGSRIDALERSIEVNMDYELPEEFKDKPLYAVFANEDEESDEMLSAVKAEYIEETGQITFDTAQLGDFVIAALEFEGEEFSPEFYDALEKAPEVQPLIELIKEKAEQAGTGE